MINAILRLRRDNDYNYEKIKDTFIPANGEICLVDTARYGLRAVCGDGVSTFGQLKYIGESIKQGYYNENTSNFYIDKNLTIEAEKGENIIYLDIKTSQLYYWTGELFKAIELNLPTASETIMGVLKLYDSTGINTDGTMTQKAITEGMDDINEKLDTMSKDVDTKINSINEELDTKVELSLKEDEELVIFLI